MKPIICLLIVSNLLLAKVVVENNGQVIHIYDIPNSQITDVINNITIDKSVDSIPAASVMKSKDIVSEDNSNKDIQKADIPVDPRVCDTFAVINTQLKFLFHKPLSVQSIKMSWSNHRNQSLQDCVNRSDTAGTISILIDHTDLSFAEAFWLIHRIWPYWINASPNCFINK